MHSGCLAADALAGGLLSSGHITFFNFRFFKFESDETVLDLYDRGRN